MRRAMSFGQRAVRFDMHVKERKKVHPSIVDESSSALSFRRRRRQKWERRRRRRIRRSDGDGEGALLLLLLLFFFSSFSVASFSMVEISWIFSPFTSIKSHLFPFLEVDFFPKHWLWKSDAGFIGFEEGSETCVVCVCVCVPLFVFQVRGEKNKNKDEVQILEL